MKKRIFGGKIVIFGIGARNGASLKARSVEVEREQNMERGA